MGQQKWQDPSRAAVFYSLDNKGDEKNSRLVSRRLREADSIRPTSKNRSPNNNHSTAKKPTQE